MWYLNKILREPTLSASKGELWQGYRLNKVMLTIKQLNKQSAIQSRSNEDYCRAPREAVFGEDFPETIVTDLK